ncbi:MAG: DUF2911 domain-containing protein [Gemmatimonadales bacterium]
MRRTLGFFVSLGVLAGPAAAQSGAFVTRLGRDTLAVERYRRTANRIEGELVIRSPRTQHRMYTATLGSDGSVERFELTTHNLSAGGPAEQKASIAFRGDSALVTLPDGQIQRRAATGGGAPFLLNVYGLVEYLAARARTAGGDEYRTTAVFPNASEPLATVLKRVGRDSMTILIGQIGPLRLRVDASGTLLGVTGVGSTMQVTVERVPAIDIAAMGPAFADRPLGVLSPTDSVQATVGGATLSVKYSRPSVRGRAIFGAVVPWNQVWRTGANAATIFTTSADLVMGGTPIPAGSYSLWTIPSPARWTLIVNKNTGQWGTNYDSQHDLAKIDMRVAALDTLVEQFTIQIAPSGESAGSLALAWEKTRAWVAFSKK